MQRRFLPLAAMSLALVCFCAPQTRADSVTIVPTVQNIAIDFGQADGVFDAFYLAAGPGNNGYSDVRYAALLPIGGIPAGSLVTSATLTLLITNPEGTRTFEVHGFAGNGTLQLSDFSLNGLLGSSTLQPIATATFTFDVAAFIQNLLTGGSGFAGINVREFPANSSNFILFSVDAAVLNVQYTPPAPVPEPASIFLLSSGLALLWSRALRIRAR